MKQNYNFFKTTFSDSRKADFYLGCLDSSVYIDFTYTSNNCISLRRISFDGYGCCNLDISSNSLDYQTSKLFINEFKKVNLDQEIITKIVLQLIELNKEYIWIDALLKYNLINNKI